MQPTREMPELPDAWCSIYGRPTADSTDITFTHTHANYTTTLSTTVLFKLAYNRFSTSYMCCYIYGKEIKEKIKDILKTETTYR